MRHTGKVTDWNDERGFEFVVPDSGDRAFLHISQVKPRSRRPADGDQVTYSTGKDSRGRLQATRVRYRSSRRAQGRRAVLPRATLGLTALTLAAAGYFAGLLPRPVAGAYLLCSIISFLAYGKDKHAARHDRWRTPESTLHLFDLLGGWPGGLIAQRLFHHKTIKTSFQVVFWLTVAANIAAVWWFNSGI